MTLKADRELERYLEGFFRERVRLLGGHTIKLAPTEAGVPDRLVLFPGGRMYLVELKRDGGALRPIQELWHNRMRRLGTNVHVLYGREGIVRWLAQVVESMGPQNGKPGRRPRA
jgi:hypothetical protein